MHAVPKRTVYQSRFNEALLRCWILLLVVLRHTRRVDEEAPQ